MSGNRVSKVRPFNAYAGYPSECAVGQVLYHVRADRPSELRCSWGGPANRIGGNGPADGEWQPVVQEVCAAGTLEPNDAEGLGVAPRNWCGEKTTIALRTEDSKATVASFTGSMHVGAAAIDDVTVAARWGDSACSFVLDLQGGGAHYALPQDIALAQLGRTSSRALENPDQILAEEKGGSTVLWPLHLASSLASTRGMEQDTRTSHAAENVEGIRRGNSTVWRVRVLMRARSFWLVSYLTCEVDDTSTRSDCWQLQIGTIDWAADVPAVIRPVDSKAKLLDAFAIVGWG